MYVDTRHIFILNAKVSKVNHNGTKGLIISVNFRLKSALICEKYSKEFSQTFAD